MGDGNARAAVAEAAARTGSEVALEWFKERLEVATKEDATDYVTEADRESQRRIVEEIRSAYPEDAVVAEEGDGRDTVPDEGAAWIIDPVDGTFDFVRGLPLWAVSVAAVRDGEPVAAANALPALDEVYVAGEDGAALNGAPVAVSDRDDPETLAVAVIDWADFDTGQQTGLLPGLAARFGEVRRFGSSQTTLTYVAGGALDAAVSTNPHPWNNVAGAHLVRRAGGTVTDLDGERWRHGSDGLVASNGANHRAVLAAVRDHLA